MLSQYSIRGTQQWFVDELISFSSVGRRESHDAVRACISMPCPGMSLNEIQGHPEITGDPKVNSIITQYKVASNLQKCLYRKMCTPCFYTGCLLI